MGRSLIPTVKLYRPGIMAPGPNFGQIGMIEAKHFVGDEETMNGATIVGFIQFERSIDERLHNRQIADQVRVILGQSNRGQPGVSRPKKKWDILFICLFYCLDGIRPQFCFKIAVAGLKPSQAVVTRSQVKSPGPVAKSEGRLQIGVFKIIGLQLDIDITVLGKTAGQGIEETFVMGNLIEERSRSVSINFKLKGIAAPTNSGSSSEVKVVPPSARASAILLTATFFRVAHPLAKMASSAKAKPILIFRGKCRVKVEQTFFIGDFLPPMFKDSI